MKIFKRNKKGDIGITILVMGVFAVCSLALLTFYVSDYNISNSFVGVDVMHKLNADIDLYKFYKSEGISQDKLDSYFNLTKKGDDRYFYREILGSGNIFPRKSEKVILFSVEYKLPS